MRSWPLSARPHRPRTRPPRGTTRARARRRACERGSRGVIAKATVRRPGTAPDGRPRAGPGRDHRRHRLRGRRADPDADAPSQRRHRRARRPRSRPRADRALPTRISPGPAWRSTRASPTPKPSSSRCRTARRPRSCRTSSRRAPRSSTSGPTSGCATPPTTRAGTASSIPRRTSSRGPSTACRSCIGRSSRALRTRRQRDRRRARLLPDRDPARTGAARPGRARSRDLVVDAKSGVSGAGREAEGRPHLRRGQRERQGVRRRRPSPRRRDRAGAGRRWRPATGANPGADAVDFVPHLIPMTRGILSTCHVRPTRPDRPGRARRALRRGVRGRALRASRRRRRRPRSTCWAATAPNVFVRHDPRTNRILAIGVIDNLVKGAAGQGVQAFNLVHGLPETAGLDALPIAP